MTMTTSVPSKNDYQDIKVRRMDFEFPDSTPTYWFDDNPFLTALVAALAVSFPPGERYFIQSVKHFLPQVKDPELREAVRAFIGQEGMHTKEHLAFNRFLDRRGLPATAMEKFVEKQVKRVQKESTPEENLARTAALEHFTALLAGALLGSQEALDRMSPEVATLWAWHAIEEVEHRSVAFDVYQQAVGDDRLRHRVMAEVTVLFWLTNVIRTGFLLRAWRKLGDFRSLSKGFRVLFRDPGILRDVPKEYIAYYKKGFHPSQHDYSDKVAAARERYLGEAA